MYRVAGSSSLFCSGLGGYIECCCLECGSVLEATAVHVVNMVQMEVRAQATEEFPLTSQLRDKDPHVALSSSA